MATCASGLLIEEDKNNGSHRSVLLVANTSWYLYNFRLPLLKALRKARYDVAVIAPHDAYTPLLEAEGFKVHSWLVRRNSINPLLELRAIVDLIRIYRRERPALVHHFTIKACLYGTIAAKATRIYRVVNAITGLGHVFLGQRKRHQLLRRFLRPLYRAVFMARRATVVFQNADDQERLIRLGITNDSRSRLIRGSGVDINHFSPLTDSAGHFQSTLQLLFPSRLIREKGIQELLHACQELWSDGYDVKLLVAGELDVGNRSSLNHEEVDALKNDSRISCLGHVEDMRALYASSDVVVLPSWREGLSRSLIEAAAMERPIITTDVPGCKDVVDHGRSGLLVPLRDARSLRLAIELLINNPVLARNFGKAAREKIESEFQVSFVNKDTLKQYDLLFENPLERRSLLSVFFN